MEHLDRASCPVFFVRPTDINQRIYCGRDSFKKFMRRKTGWADDQRLNKNDPDAMDKLFEKEQAVIRTQTT